MESWEPMKIGIAVQGWLSMSGTATCDYLQLHTAQSLRSRICDMANPDLDSCSMCCYRRWCCMVFKVPRSLAL